MSKKKIICILLVLVCFLLIVWQPQKITLKIGIFAGSNWDVPNGDCYKIIDQVIERFEKKYPMVNVEYESGIIKDDYSQWLSSQYLKGEEPDVFMILSEDFNTLSALGALKDLDCLIQQDAQFNKDNYYKSALDTGKYHGNQYALPYESNPTLMFVNKTLLKNENIDIPDNNWTLDDFYEICKQITKDTNNDGQIDQYGCYNYDWLDSIYSHEINLFDDDGDECYLSQESVKSALSFVQRLTELNKGYAVTSQDFDTGKVAFSPMTFAEYRTYKPYPYKVKKYSQFEWDCVKMPGITQETGSEVSSLLMGISSRTSHEKKAWEFLKMLTYDQESQENLFRYSQGISSLKTVIQSSKALNMLSDEELGDTQVDLSLLNDVMQNTISQNQFKKYNSALSMMDTQIQNIIKNGQDLDLSLMSLQNEINEFLRE